MNEGRDRDGLGVGLWGRLRYGGMYGVSHRRSMFGVCSEFGFGSFPEMSVGDCVPLHPPPLQGSDILALLTIMFEMGWHRSLQIVCVKGLPGVSDKTPQCVPVRELLLLVPRSYVRFRILPI